MGICYVKISNHRDPCGLCILNGLMSKRQITDIQSKTHICLSPLSKDVEGSVGVSERKASIRHMMKYRLGNWEKRPEVLTRLLT